MNKLSVVRGALALVAVVLLGQVGLAQTTTPKPQATNPNQKPKTCKEWLPLGTLYYSQGQINEAYLAFRLCVSLEPKNTQALYNLGRTEIRLQLYSQATEHCKQVLSLEPKFIGAYVCWAQSLTGQYEDAEDRTAARGQLDEALRVMDEAARFAGTDEDKAKVANQRGYIYRLRNQPGDSDKAIEHFKKAAVLRPDDYAILYNLGTTQLQAGKLDDAIDTLRNAVEAKPDDAINRAQLSRALRLKGDIKAALSEARQAYTACGSAKCKNPFVVGQYGTTQYFSKNLVAAKGLLEQAVKLDANAVYHENYYHLGRVYLDQNQLKESRAQFSKAVALYQLDAEYFYYLGLANEKIGEKDNACKAYLQATKIAAYKPAQEKVSGLGCK